MNDKRYLFRGFHADEKGNTMITVDDKVIKGRWVYGSLINLDKTKYICYADVRHNIFDIGALSATVIHETIGQWVTTDKNGKDVFEGDLFKAHHWAGVVEIKDRVYEMVWENGSYFCRFYIRQNRYDSYLNEMFDLELIGNKWECEK